MGTLLSFSNTGTQTDQREKATDRLSNFISWICPLSLSLTLCLTLSRGACRILYNISPTSGSFYWLAPFMGLHQVKPNPPLLKASYFQCTNAQVTILSLQLMKCDILDDFLWNMSKTTTRADWTALIISLRSIVATDCLWRSAQSRLR